MTQVYGRVFEEEALTLLLISCIRFGNLRSVRNRKASKLRQAPVYVVLRKVGR